MKLVGHVIKSVKPEVEMFYDNTDIEQESVEWTVLKIQLHFKRKNINIYCEKRQTNSD